MFDKNTFMAKLVRSWPALPYMSLGAMLAAMYIANSGTAWLSDNEMNGGNLSTLFIAASLASGCVMFLATFRVPKAKALLERPSVSLWAGVVSASGALLVIIIGPYYLYNYLPEQCTAVLFMVGSIVFGAGLGLIGLRNGQLYGALTPRYVIVYVGFSQLIVGATFFIVVGSPTWAPIVGGPSLAGIVVFVGMPLVAGVLAYLSRFGEQVSHSPNKATSRASLPKSFWKLLAVVLVFSCIVSSVHASTVATASIEETLNGSRLVMLLRMAFALGLIVVATGTESGGIRFGKIYSVVMVVSVGLVACLPLVSMLQTMLSQIVSFASVIFGLFLWCILAFIVRQRKVSAVIVFGFGYGAYLLGDGIGWLFGVKGLASLFDLMSDAFVYMIMALIVLACAFIIFSEREFDQLFAPVKEGNPTLDELFMKDLEGEGGRSLLGDDEPIKKGRFGFAIDSLAATHQLSPRETDVLRCLAMGYNSSTIAHKLSISWNTVRTHVRNVYGKLGVHSQQELISLVDEQVDKD